MTIVVIGPTYPYKGGGAQHTTELAHRLAARGHDVVIESWAAQYPSFLYPGQQTIDEPEGAPFPVVRREMHWRRPLSWRRAGRRARAADVVVLAVLSPVQVPAYLGVLSGLRAARKRLQAPRVVALCHNVLPHEPKPYDRPLMRALLRRVDLVLTHGAEQAALASELSPVPNRVATLPPFLPERREADTGPGDTGLGDSVVHHRLLFFGLVRPYKGLDVLLRALAAGPPQVSLTVAGEFWAGLDETRALVSELGLDDRVDIRPAYVPAGEVRALFAQCDALVLPYRSATGSQNVWLGHEYGVPVIATRLATFADHIADGVDGLVVAPGSVEALADALRRFYRPGEPQRLRSAVKPVDRGPYWEAYVRTLLAP